jgi:hypothetical protein
MSERACVLRLHFLALPGELRLSSEQIQASINVIVSIRVEGRVQHPQLSLRKGFLSFRLFEFNSNRYIFNAMPDCSQSLPTD